MIIVNRIVISICICLPRESQYRIYNFKQAEAEKERKQKEEAARNQMKPASTDSEESDDELDIELKRLVCYTVDLISGYLQ